MSTRPGVHTTDYRATFIQVAEDCPVSAAEVPGLRAGRATVASLQYELISEHPYELTSDDVLFTVHADRQGVTEEDRPAARVEFFARAQACLRASPLGKRHGWGIHSDEDGRVALVPLGSAQYAALAADPSLKQLRAMRSKRA
ncbi:DUF6157 family protein [Quadrisphaera sp. KR29]|uniref:DUF6157 family protein n=1 Tax=Quadrisphaera sp. KR29 TaxID=3461391 RepID=UPI004044B3AB